MFAHLSLTEPNDLWIFWIEHAFTPVAVVH